MGIYNDLDIIIQEHSENDEDYLILKSMIMEHFEGKKTYDMLPEKAQCILMEWEELERMMI